MTCYHGTNLAEYGGGLGTNKPRKRSEERTRKTKRLRPHSFHQKTATGAKRESAQLQEHPIRENPPSVKHLFHHLLYYVIGRLLQGGQSNQNPQWTPNAVYLAMFTTSQLCLLAIFGSVLLLCVPSNTVLVLRKLLESTGVTLYHPRYQERHDIYRKHNGTTRVYIQ